MTDIQHTHSDPGSLGRRGSKLRIAIVIATIVIATVGVVVVFSQAGKDSGTTRGVTSTLRLDGRPNGLVAGSDALWVGLIDEPPALAAKVERLSLATGAVEHSVPLDGVLSSMRRVGDSVWIHRSSGWQDSDVSELVELDWRTGKVLGRRPFDAPAYGFAYGEDSLWVALGTDPATLVRIDPGTRTQIGEPIELGSGRAIGLEFGAGALWAALAESGTLVRVDPRSGRVTRVKVGDFPVGIAIVDGTVWVANRASGTVSHVDPASMRVAATIDVGLTPTWIAAAGDSLWVSNQSDGTVTRIDAMTEQPVGSPIEIAIPVDDAAAHVLAVDGDSLWVASATEETLSRIDTSR